MNKLFFVICVMTVSTLKAQLISGGLYRNQIINSDLKNISSQAIELSSTHYFFNVNIGAGFGRNNNSEIKTKYLGAEFTPTGFHHAYIAHKFAPYIGFQIKNNRITDLNNGINNEVKIMEGSKNTMYSLNVGFKYSYNRMIFSSGFLMGKNEKALALKIAYVFAVTHKCLKKHLVPLELGF